MADNQNNLIYLKVWGENACFTRPEMKVERVSYDVMTPSSARGVITAILWKPAIEWIIKQIDVLNPVRWESVRRNEVASVISVDNITQAMKGGSTKLGLYIEEDRQQRAGMFLRDVAYVIHAECRLSSKADPSDNIIKYLEMFRRRASKGQCFMQPYLGCREFSGYFDLVSKENLPTPINETKDLGWMLHDLDYSDPKNPTPFFFRAQIQEGRIKVPAINSQEVKA